MGDQNRTFNMDNMDDSQNMTKVFTQNDLAQTEGSLLYLKGKYSPRQHSLFPGYILNSETNLKTTTLLKEIRTVPIRPENKDKEQKDPESCLSIEKGMSETQLSLIKPIRCEMDQEPGMIYSHIGKNEGNITPSFEGKVVSKYNKQGSNQSKENENIKQKEEKIVSRYHNTHRGKIKDEHSSLPQSSNTLEQSSKILKKETLKKEENEPEPYSITKGINRGNSNKDKDSQSSEIIASLQKEDLEVAYSVDNNKSLKESLDFGVKDSPSVYDAINQRFDDTETSIDPDGNYNKEGLISKNYIYSRKNEQSLEQSRENSIMTRKSTFSKVVPLSTTISRQNV